MKKKKHSIKFKEATRKVTEAMELAAANSDWNFSNKRYLLHAEQQALCQGKYKYFLENYFLQEISTH